METDKDASKIILLEADITFHFMFADELPKLPAIMPGMEFRILDIVYDELTVVSRYKKQLDNLFNVNNVKPMEFPNVADIKKSYAQFLKEGKGKGESACMATALHFRHEIASSNWPDIANFCKGNGIKHYSTLDLLCFACRTGVLSESECEYFIKAVRGKRGKVPYTMKEYLEMISRGHRSDLYAD